jgi:hypothetical protein
LQYQKDIISYVLGGIKREPQLLENSQLALMDEKRGSNEIFTLWAIFEHPTSPCIRTAHKSSLEIF